MDTLRLTSPYMDGPAVARLQEYLDSLGFDEGENDGIFGPATERAVKRAQERFGIDTDGICGKKTWRAILSAMEGDDPETAEAGQTGQGAEGIVDRRGEHSPPKLYARKREWDQITGVTLHQTGCQMSKKPRGWDRLNAHIGITGDGLVVIANDPTDMIWHAQGLSKQTIGIEICGNFCGIDGNKRTLWKGGGGPDVLNDAMIRGLERAFDWIAAEFEKHHQKWQQVHAHRQSCDTRRGDPGSEIWQKIGMEWIRKIDGTDGGPDFKLKKGRAIPKEWNSAYTAPY